MKQGNRWGILGSLLFAGLAFAEPTIPVSVKVTVLVPNGPSQAKAEYKVPGVLYTRLDGQDREKIGGKPPRMQPLITWGKDESFEFKWREALPLAIALERLAVKDGTLIFEMEDGTWTTGMASGITVRDDRRESLYLTVTVWDLKAEANGTLRSVPRDMNIPLEDVADRVFRTPKLTAEAARDKDAQYFLASDDERLLPVTVLGIQDVFAWVCATTDLATSSVRDVEKFLIPLEALRRIPKVELAKPAFLRGNRYHLSKNELKHFSRPQMPDCLLELAEQAFGRR